MPLTTVAQMEGITLNRAIIIVRELEKEHGFKYQPSAASDTPFGLTPATSKLRANLGLHLYFLREKETRGMMGMRTSSQVGINIREQINAVGRPYNFDWKLSQIERLARTLGRDPLEFLIECCKS